MRVNPSSELAGENTLEVCWDTAKAFVEFRLRQKPIDALDQILRRPRNADTDPSGGWRRLYLVEVGSRPWCPAPADHAAGAADASSAERTEWMPPAEIRRLQDCGFAG